MVLSIGNNQSQLVGSRQLIHTLREKSKLRVKGAFFAPSHVSNGGSWDGFHRFITEAGRFPTGQLQTVINYLKDLGEKFEIEDGRTLLYPEEIITGFGDMDAREYQEGGADAFFAHSIGGIPFQRGCLNFATNAGKSFIAACIYASYKEGTKGILLIHNKTIFLQLREEITALLGKKAVGWVAAQREGGVKWSDFNICMVQSLNTLLKSNVKIRNELAVNQIIMVDEADETAHRNDTQNILKLCYNSTVRLALTGTAGLSKDKVRNRNLISYFGPIIKSVRNKELVDSGFSAKPVIEICEGNTSIEGETWQEEYIEGVVRNKERNKKVWKRIKRHYKKGRLPIVVIIKLHEHLKNLEKLIPKELRGLRVDYIHGKSKHREVALKEFKEGKIDILFSSMIISRGKNLPNMAVLINAAGGDSYEQILQIFGRLLRMKKGTKEKGYMDDFYDKCGKYLRRHSKHRVIYYKNEGFPVKESYLKK